MKTFSRRRASRQAGGVEPSDTLLRGLSSQDSDKLSFLDSPDDPFFFPEEPIEWEATEQQRVTAKQPKAGVRVPSSSGRRNTGVRQAESVWKAGVGNAGAVLGRGPSSSVSEAHASTDEAFDIELAPAKPAGVGRYTRQHSLLAEQPSVTGNKGPRKAEDRTACPVSAGQKQELAHGSQDLLEQTSTSKDEPICPKDMIPSGSALRKRKEPASASSEATAKRQRAQEVNPPLSSGVDNAEQAATSGASNMAGLPRRPASASKAGWALKPQQPSRLSRASGSGSEQPRPIPGSKLSRSSAPQIPLRKGQQPTGAPVVAASSNAPVVMPGPIAKPKVMQQEGLRTPLYRHALSQGLARLLSGPAFCSPSPAVTVMEAQESGELIEIQDSVLYALDGLCSTSSLETHRESAASLAEACATRRGRLALKADGVFVEVMSAGIGLLRRWDPDLALSFATILLAFSKDAVYQALLATEQAARLLYILLQGARDRKDREVKKDTTSSPKKSIARLLGDSFHARGLPPEATECASSLALLTIAGATDPQQVTGATEALKSALREQGVLDSLAAMAAEQPMQQEPPYPSKRWLWLLHKCLVNLENASFACSDNEAHLVMLRISSPCGAADRDLGGCLVRQVDFLLGAGQPEPGASSAWRALHADCLHCALSVLMNITRHNDEGCRQVAEAGGLEIAARLLASTLGKPSEEERVRVRDNIDLISVVMGVLINAAENCPASRRRITQVPLADDQPFLHVLGRLMQAAMPGSRAASPWSEGEGLEITEAQLAQQEEEGAASIVETYAALLLGFLVAQGPALRAEAAAVMPGSNLDPVVAGVQRCLRFYMDTGAITERTEASLRSLLADLEAA